jgi:membrane-associated protein
VDFSALLGFSTIEETLLNYVVDNTYPVVAATVLLGAAGLPLPASLVILMAGALAGQGDASLSAVVLITVFFATMGDSIGYAVGSLLTRRNGWLSLVSRGFFRRGADAFNKNAFAAIFFSRFLFTILGTPVNLLAAGYNVGYRRFLAIAAAGEMIWALELGLIGYFVGAYVEEIFQLISNASVALALLLCVAWLFKKSS